MNDADLARLFQVGTAPERDLRFSERTTAYLQRSQQISALLKGVKVCCVTMLVVGLFLLTQMYQAAFGTVANEVASSMSAMVVPVLVAVVCAVVGLLRRRVR